MRGIISVSVVKDEIKDRLWMWGNYGDRHGERGLGEQSLYTLGHSRLSGAASFPDDPPWLLVKENKQKGGLSQKIKKQKTDQLR